MKNKIMALIGAGALIALVAVPAIGADEQGVTATVTVQNISVSVSDGNVAYGTLGVNTSKDTTTGGTDESQTATNDGNIIENFNIKGSGSANWALAGTAGADQYVHEFCTAGAGSPDPCDASPVYTALTTNYQSLTSSVAPSGTQLLDLKITTPTSSSNFTEQSVDVTVQATAV